MIALTYACGVCRYATPILDNAILHANTQRHTVVVRGQITPEELKRPWKLDATEAAKVRAREAEILRRAKEKGFVR